MPVAMNGLEQVCLAQGELLGLQPLDEHACWRVGVGLSCQHCMDLQQLHCLAEHAARQARLCSRMVAPSGYSRSGQMARCSATEPGMRCAMHDLAGAAMSPVCSQVSANAPSSSRRT